MPHHTGQTPPLVVLLSGWAGSGKDTAAALLVDELEFVRLAYADALKEDAAQLTGIPLSVFHSVRKNAPLTVPVAAFPEARSPRDLLIQRAAAMRTIAPDTYATTVATQIGSSGCYVVSDWRYVNEYDVMRCTIPKDANLLRVRVVRSDMPALTDPTEHYLDNEVFDAIVQNDGSISDLRDNIKAIVHPYLSHNWSLQSLD